MRKCPVCGSDERKVVIDDYGNFADKVSMSLCACECGMHYVDAPWLTPMWFANYYLTEYKTDDKPYSDGRLGSLARYIASLDPLNVLDIGGMDGELQERLNELDVLCDVTGVINDNQKKYDIVVLSHTLEHIYDIPSMFSRILGNLSNRLIIEVPLWLNYESLYYDNHWQHVNKFTKHQLGTLLTEYQFQYRFMNLPDYREYHCIRAVAWQIS